MSRSPAATRRARQRSGGTRSPASRRRDYRRPRACGSCEPALPWRRSGPSWGSHWRTARTASAEGAAGAPTPPAGSSPTHERSAGRTCGKGQGWSQTRERRSRNSAHPPHHCRRARGCRPRFLLRTASPIVRSRDRDWPCRRLWPRISPRRARAAACRSGRCCWKLRMLLLGNAAGHEDAEVTDARMDGVDDGLAVGANFVDVFVQIENPSERLLRRRDVVALRAEHDDGGADVAKVDRGAVRRLNSAGREIVADEQLIDDELHLLGVEIDVASPP